MENQLSSIISKGFHIPERGGLFVSCGYIPAKIEKNSVNKLIISEVAIHNTTKISSDSSKDHLFKEQQPEGYDSYYLNPLAEVKEHPFASNFVLVDDNQIIPLFLVDFKYTQNVRGVYFY